MQRPQSVRIYRLISSCPVRESASGRSLHGLVSCGRSSSWSCVAAAAVVVVVVVVSADLGHVAHDASITHEDSSRTSIASRRSFQLGIEKGRASTERMGEWAGDLSKIDLRARARAQAIASR